MNTTGRFLLTMAIAVVGLLAATVAVAQTELRFSPQDTTMSVGGTGRLSIMLDEVLDVRSIEVSVTYNPQVLESIGGQQGQGFTDTGCQLFDGFDDSTPGLWHGYVVILGADCWLTGPAELFAWEFASAVPGTSAITAVDIALYAPQSGEIEGVTLPATTVTVIDPNTPAPDQQVWSTLLEASPNPFNPRTTVSFELEETGPAKIVVYDLTGRQVDVLADRAFPAGTHAVTWDGRDTLGRLVPAGTYVCRLVTKGGAESLKVSLVK